MATEGDSMFCHCVQSHRSSSRKASETHSPVTKAGLAAPWL